RPWRAYFGIIAMGIGAHIAGDVITSYGTMIFAPFSSARFALGTTFIIDLWFSGIIVAGLVACGLWRKSALPAMAGLAVLCAYVAFQGVQQERAIGWGANYARLAGLKDATVEAQARPLSPPH